ncbi:signal transduction histidine-protein kinase BarA [mine drainage metagenome]|uniref:histidine kinase n=1 Tax=mine drainage metagenome TaxID=410659 RepID=A0A1J5RDK0_9ZZZZ
MDDPRMAEADRERRAVRQRRGRGILLLGVAVPVAWLVSTLFCTLWFEARLDDMVRQARDNALAARRDVRLELQTSLSHVVGLTRDFAADPQVIDLLKAPKESALARRANVVLANRTRELGMDLAWLMDSRGNCLAASDFDDPITLVGGNFSDRQYFQLARRGVMGRQFAVGRLTSIPGLYFSAPVWEGDTVIGVMALKINLTSLAAEIMHNSSFVTDQQGVVILSHTPADLFRALDGGSVHALSREARLAQYKRADLPPMPLEQAHYPHHPEIMRVGTAGTLAVVSSEDLPVEGLSIHALGELNQLGQLAADRDHLQQGLTAGLTLLFWSVVAALTWWRRAQRQVERLRQAEEQFRAAFQYADIGKALIAPDERFLQVNAALCRLLGHDENALLSLSMRDLAHPDDRDIDRALIQDCLARKRSGYQLEKRYLDRRGNTVWGLQTMTLLRDAQGQPLHFICQLQDFSERHRSEEALRGYVREIQDLYDHAPCGYHSLDSDGVIVRINDTELSWLGYDWKEVVGHLRIQDLLTPDSLLMFEATFEQFKRQGYLSDMVLEIRRKDGSVMPVLVSATAIYDGQGNYLMSRSTVYDMTERKRIEDDLANAKMAAEAANRAKSDFVANMSHEIRTPMNAVLGLTHLLRKGTLAADQRALVDKIAISARSLLGIIDEILDFSKIEAGRLQLEHIEFDLERVLEGLATVMSINASAKDLELIIDVGADVPRTLKGDPSRLQQVLINLAGNALKFTERGEVAVRISKAADLADGRVMLTVSVKDTGIGISEEQQARLFTPFTQADTTTTRRFGGTGLGLVICKRLLEMMGGTIRLTSRVGEGSEFVVDLPFGLGRQAPPEKSRVLEALSVLVVDDNATARRALVSAVEALGWTAAVAVSGPEAMDRHGEAERAGRPFDLWLVDLRMPGLDGLGTAERARRAGWSDLPIVVMASAFDRDEVMASHRAALVDGVLLKPVTYSALFNVVAEAQAHRLGVTPLVEEASARAGEGDPLAGLRLLLVEDNAINQEVAQFILEEKGAQVEIAGDGLQAVERLRQGGGDFDLVLMDVQMPEMDGFEATRLIRGELGLTLPVLALTAGVRDADRAQCLACGMNDFIAKPFDLEQMVAVILKHSRAAAAAPMPAPGAAAPPPDDATDALALFDARQGLLRLGDEGQLHRLLRRLVAESGTTLEAARAALLRGDRRETAARLHALRGAAANVAALRLASRATETEAALLDGQDARARALLELTERDFAELCLYVRTHLPLTGDVTTQA